MHRFFRVLTHPAVAMVIGAGLGIGTMLAVRPPAPAAQATLPFIAPLTHFTFPFPVAQTVGEPQTLIIPKLGISAYVENVGKTSIGTMDTPTRSNDVAWYRYGPRPGEDGQAVIAGHLDTATGA